MLADAVLSISQKRASKVLGHNRIKPTCAVSFLYLPPRGLTRERARRNSYPCLVEIRGRELSVGRVASWCSLSNMYHSYDGPRRDPFKDGRS